MPTVFAPRPELTAPRDYVFPTPEQRRLATGLSIELFEAPDGLITLSLVTRGGMSAESAGKEGVANLAVKLRREGTEAHTAEEFATELDRLGASWTSSVAEGATVTTIGVPLSGLAQALELLGETVLWPTYPEAEFERLRAEALQSARSALIDPGMRAEIAMREATFAAEDRSSRSREGSVETLEGLTREDLLEFERATLNPEATTLVIGGRLEGVIDDILHASLLARWTGSSATSEDERSRPAAATPRVIIVNRPESVQTEIRCAAVVPAATDNEYAALSIAAQALGGSMNSRLSATLREEKGYTYGVFATVSRMPGRGRFMIGTPVDTSSTPDALADLVRIVDELRDSGVTEEEVKRSQDELLLAAPLQYQAVMNVVAQRVDQLTNHLPEGWLTEHRARLRKVTAAAATEAFRRHVPTSAVAAAFVGDAGIIADSVAGAFVSAVEVQGL